MIKFIENYFAHSDERGSIKGLFNFGTWEEGNLITSNAGTIRGGHYHKGTNELFIILDGRIEITTKELGGDKEVVSVVTTGDVFFIEPNIVHTFKCIEDSRWINVLSKKMEQVSPDFYRE
ncbi:MAG: cupin domain-containing protein [Bacteriovoracaceae bacterium]|nr:cupin domain-containing protein [Bacteriovoracaceae bacterium]